MVEGRSKQVFETAATGEPPDAVTVMDPFHVVRLAGDALDACRRRVQQTLHGHRGAQGRPSPSGPEDPCTPANLAYREPDRARGRPIMRRPTEPVDHGVPKALTEVITLGRTLKQRADDVLAYFDRPGTSNGPTDAIYGRLEHLRDSALGIP